MVATLRISAQSLAKQGEAVALLEACVLTAELLELDEPSEPQADKNMAEASAEKTNRFNEVPLQVSIRDTFKLTL